jgi:hypothetical protein
MGATVALDPATTVQAQGPNGASVTSTMETQGNQGQPMQPETPQQPVHDWEKRYKDLQSYHSKQMNGKTAEIAALQSSTNTFQVPKTAEQLAAFQAENPESYAVIQSIAHNMASQQTAHVQERLDRAEDTLEKDTYQKQLAELQRLHPDFEQIDAAPEFHTWLSQQNDEVKGWVFETPSNPQKITWALSLFKQQAGMGVQNPQGNTGNTPSNTLGTPQDMNELASMDVSVRSESQGAGDQREHPQYVWAESEISRMRPEVFAKYEASIELAMSEGRIDSRR